MDEYEKIEVELVKLYETYMERFRNLTFLEQQVDEYNRDEQDKAEVPEHHQKFTKRKMKTRSSNCKIEFAKRSYDFYAVQGRDLNLKRALKDPSVLLVYIKKIFIHIIGAGRHSHNFDDSDTESNE